MIASVATSHHLRPHTSPRRNPANSAIRAANANGAGEPPNNERTRARPPSSSTLGVALFSFGGLRDATNGVIANSPSSHASRHVAAK